MSVSNQPHQFDFEIGYLIKSPCVKCEFRSRFPGCAATCTIIEKIQDRLTSIVSCSQRG